jgi:hypothetical protein
VHAGARAIDQTNEQETLWGVRVVKTTQQADGTASILSVQRGAAVVYIREALTTFFDPYSQAALNIYQFIAETRLCLATPRPGAICLVTGLPDNMAARWGLVTATMTGNRVAGRRATCRSPRQASEAADGGAPA